MIIKKFQAETETEAIMMAKEEMGKDAVVLNVKTTKQKGFKRLFKKDIVEITAALEEKRTTANIPIAEIKKESEVKEVKEDNNKSSAIEEKLNNLQSMIETKLNSPADNNDVSEMTEPAEKNVNFAFLRLVYSQLLDNEVDEKYANMIIGEIEAALKKESNIDSILSGIYQKIILKLGQPEPIELVDNKTKLIFLVGPTGVGKTTTIAKLASEFKLNKKAKVGMITSDTYRIAAVEQLRTYASILDIPLQVVFTIEELNSAVKQFEGYDIIFVDTAGRSHRNVEQCDELFHLIKDIDIDSEQIDKEIYLVLSTATKYKDLLKITDTYENLSNYKLIFTKVDETSAIGNILNIKLKTKAPLSYITGGQAVPDDISVVDMQKIAKQLLGGSE
ncbi:MAG: flagellar biosynthesis protein FlhF [Lachnospiraceae bacterium]|nr:flagellar biosynthesis protein FlhF [Lachnospiraceae bacterium]